MEERAQNITDIWYILCAKQVICLEYLKKIDLKLLLLQLFHGVWLATYDSIAFKSDSFLPSGDFEDNFSALSFVCVKLYLLQIFYTAENHDSCLLKEGKYEPELQDANVPEEAIMQKIQLLNIFFNNQYS